MTKKMGKCPQCKKKIELIENPYRPFCSERCKMMDLGAWFSDEYVVERKDDARENEEEG